MIRAISKYGAFVKVAAARSLREPGELYGRVVFFAVILGVFSSLWRAVAEAGMPIAADPRALVWYLAATEWILLSAPTVHVDLQEAIRRGDVACQLGRPVSFVGAAFAEGLGLLAVRAPVLGATAFVCAYLFTAWTPPLSVFLRVVPFGLIAAAVITGLYLGIGLLAFWLQDVSPVYWVWQKLMFVLGGLMLPLQVYPEFIQRAAAVTPFPSVLGGPASFVLRDASAGAATLAWQLALWGSLTAWAVSFVFRRAVAALTINGG
jgi:viologen exporter family transport system permease protein